MNESLLVKFQSGGAPRRIVEFNMKEGIVFDHHPDASPLVCAFSLKPLLPQVLRPVQMRHDWPADKFYLDVRLQDGGLLFSGAGGDADGFPASPYDVTIEVEAMRYSDNMQRVVTKSGKRVTMTVNEEPEKRKIKLVTNVDDDTRAVMTAADSKIDGLPLLAWLKSPDPRISRKACLLNVLAKLRTPFQPKKWFTPLVDFVYFADVDRVYAGASAELVSAITKLVEKGLWAAEGVPKAAIHQRLKASLVRLGIPEADAKRFELASYREGGRNSLQIVVASPPAGFADPMVYLDIDIDLGNPLWDLEGLFVHLGELLDPGRTDHLALCSKLKASASGDFVYYDVVKA